MLADYNRKTSSIRPKKRPYRDLIFLLVMRRYPIAKNNRRITEKDVEKQYYDDLNYIYGKTGVFNQRLKNRLHDVLPKFLYKNE